MHPFFVFLIIIIIRTLSLVFARVRTITRLRKKLIIGFIVGITEVALWLMIIALALEQIRSNWIYAMFYAFGFAIGNVLGFLLEGALPWGNVEVVIYSPFSLKLSDTIRKKGYAATSVIGKGLGGEVEVIFSYLLVKDLKSFLTCLPGDSRIFYTLNYGGKSNKITAYM